MELDRWLWKDVLHLNVKKLWEYLCTYGYLPRLRDQEVDYLQQVGRVTAAAAAIKANTFQPESLDEVARRPDELGQLALVFQEMAR